MASQITAIVFVEMSSQCRASNTEKLTQTNHVLQSTNLKRPPKVNNKNLLLYILNNQQTKLLALVNISKPKTQKNNFRGKIKTCRLMINNSCKLRRQKLMKPTTCQKTKQCTKTSKPITVILKVRQVLYSPLGTPTGTTCQSTEDQTTIR